MTRKFTLFFQIRSWSRYPRICGDDVPRGLLIGQALYHRLSFSSRRRILSPLEIDPSALPNQKKSSCRLRKINMLQWEDRSTQRRSPASCDSIQALVPQTSSRTGFLDHPFFLPRSPFAAVDHISFVAGTKGSRKICSEQEIVYNHLHGGPNVLV